MKTTETRPAHDWTARILGLTALAGTLVVFFAPPGKTRLDSDPPNEMQEPSASSQEPALPAQSNAPPYSTADERTSWQQLSLRSREISHRVRAAVVRIELPAAGEDEGTPGRANESSTQGSGLIFQSDGHIVTNYHVVRESTRVEVQLEDGRRLPAQVLSADAAIDIAILKIEASDLPTIAWADSDQLQAGDFIWALGYPYGWRQSLSFGILSAVAQMPNNASPLATLLQSDVAIHPGHSGGCWLNADGKVIGISTTIVGKTFQGLSYAIPSNVVQRALKNLQAERTGED